MLANIFLFRNFLVYVAWHPWFAQNMRSQRKKYYKACKIIYIYIQLRNPNSKFTLLSMEECNRLKSTSHIIPLSAIKLLKMATLGHYLFNCRAVVIHLPHSGKLANFDHSANGFDLDISWNWIQSLVSHKTFQLFNCVIYSATV